MAINQKLSEQVKRSIAQQLGAWITSCQQPAPPAARSESAKGIGGEPAAASFADAELGESFPIVMLARESLETTREGAPRRAFGQLLRPTDSWHHQLREMSSETNPQGQIIGCAHTTLIDGGAAGTPDRAVRAVFGPALAHQVGKAIQWLDKHVQDDSHVELLVVPDYQLHAFTLFADEKSRVLVVDRPSTFQHLNYEVLYDSDDFLDALLQEEPMAGIEL